MPVVPRTESRRTETPNAVMTTLASPSLGGTEALSLWRVEMAAAARGPLHVVDSEQVWAAVSGSADITVDDAVLRITADDTVVIPPGARRQVSATEAFTAMVAGYGVARVTVVGEDTDRGTPAWIS